MIAQTRSSDVDETMMKSIDVMTKRRRSIQAIYNMTKRGGRMAEHTPQSRMAEKWQVEKAAGVWQSEDRDSWKKDGVTEGADVEGRGRGRG